MRIGKCPNCSGIGSTFTREDWPRSGWKERECRMCNGKGTYDSSKNLKVCAICNGTGEELRKFRGEMYERLVTCSYCSGRGFLKK